MSTILVTGAAGFIGSHTVKALLAAGHTVIGMDDLNAYYDVSLKEARVQELQQLPGFTFHKIDFTDYRAAEAVIAAQPIDKICHLGARAGVRASIEDPFIYQSVNATGTLNLLELARVHGIPQFVLASTSSIYGNNHKVPFAENDNVDFPVSPYAATKKAAELLCHTYAHLHGLKVTCLRFFTVYGPWGRPDMAYFKFTDAIVHGKPIDVYNSGQHKRDFTYIDDIISGVMAALEHPFEYEIINLGNSQTVELEYFIQCIERSLGMTAVRRNVPKQPGDVDVTFADISKAKQLLGYQPTTSIDEGIEQFVQWYRSYFSV